MTMSTEFRKHYVYVTQEISGYPNAITKVSWTFEFSEGEKKVFAVGTTEFDVFSIASRGEYEKLLLADSATDADIEQAVKEQIDWGAYLAFQKKQLEGGISSHESQYFGDNTYNALDPLQVVSVTMRQARLALHQQGLLHLVEDAINLIPEPDQSKIRIEWEYAISVDKTSPWLSTFSSALGLTDQQMDDLFKLAATL